MGRFSAGKIIGCLLAAAYATYYLAQPYQSTTLDAFDLLMHEAGHWIFWPFGQFMHVLGGSLNQILIPLVFIIYFWLRREKFSASLLLYWLGINLVNVSVYAADAFKMQLPLLGGDGVIHDWNWLLSDLGWLRDTDPIAATIKFSGLLIMILAFALSFYFAQQQPTKNIL